MPAERSLEVITPENLDEARGIEVRADQRHVVAPVVTSLAEAQAFGQRAWPRLIRHDGQAVGFLMAFFDVDFAFDQPDAQPDLRSGLWRLTIAAAHQGHGHGRFAVDAVAAELRRRGATRLTTTWHVGDGSPEPFYLGLGFRATGEMSGDERVGEPTLQVQVGGEVSSSSLPTVMRSAAGLPGRGPATPGPQPGAGSS